RKRKEKTLLLLKAGSSHNKSLEFQVYRNRVDRRKTFVCRETNNHFVQSFSLGIPVNRISVLCFEYFASFLDGEILINCLELNLLQYQNFCK
ncbi:hypothetical protein Avbf_04391, partial [Armadillidium vulgare]